MNNEELKHYGIKGMKWGVRRFQNDDGSLTNAGKKRYNEEYDEERERHEKEVAARRGEKYVRKTKKERENEDAEEERKEKERRDKEDAAYKRTEDKMKEVDIKLKAKYDFSSNDSIDKYYEEYDKEWFKILYEERKKEGLSHFDLTDEELYHYGIKGQKWGIRRFQNKDGSLTKDGKKRYNIDANDLAAVKKLSTGIEDFADAVKPIAKKHNDKKVKKINNAIDEGIDKHVRKMSDQELRDAVNRLNMEERYTQVMKNRAHIEVGESKVEKYLDRTTTTLTLINTGLAIALATKALIK